MLYELALHEMLGNEPFDTGRENDQRAAMVILTPGGNIIRRVTVGLEMQGRRGERAARGSRGDGPSR